MRLASAAAWLGKTVRTEGGVAGTGGLTAGVSEVRGACGGGFLPAALLEVGMIGFALELSVTINSKGLRAGSGVNGGKTGTLELAALLLCGMTLVTGLAAEAAAC